MQNPEALEMKLADKAVLLLAFSIGLSLIPYFTFWVIVLISINGDHFINKYFFPEEYAVALLLRASMSNLCLVRILNAAVRLKSKNKEWCEYESRADVFILGSTNLPLLTYYTIWVIVLPFVDCDHFIHKYFLPQEYSIPIFGYANMALLCLACIWNGLVMLKTEEEEEEEEEEARC